MQIILYKMHITHYMILCQRQISRQQQLTEHARQLFIQTTLKVNWKNISKVVMESITIQM